MLKRKFQAPTVTGQEDKKEAVHCQECCIYIDNVKQRYPAEDGGQIVQSPIAGMQLHIKSNGTVYERRGTMIPCECELGKRVNGAYR